MNAMTLRATLSAATRAELARDTSPQFRPAQWTDHERRLNRIREDMMIAAAPKGNPNAAWLCGASTADNGVEWENATQHTLAGLTEPMTSAELARKLDQTTKDTARQLTHLKAQGLVEVVGRVFVNRGKVNQWAATGRDPHPFPRYDNGRQRAIKRVLEVMTKPMTQTELAALLDMAAHSMGTRLRAMEKDGHVRISGKRKGGNGQMVNLWVHA